VQPQRQILSSSRDDTGSNPLFAPKVVLRRLNRNVPPKNWICSNSSAPPSSSAERIGWWLKELSANGTFLVEDRSRQLFEAVSGGTPVGSEDSNGQIEGLLNAAGRGRDD
jgi:hypothetical protein